MRPFALLVVLLVPLAAVAEPVPPTATTFEVVFPWAVGADGQPFALDAGDIAPGMSWLPPAEFAPPSWLTPAVLESESVRVTVVDTVTAARAFITLPPFATWGDPLAGLTSRLPDGFDLTAPTVETYFDINGNALAVLRAVTATRPTPEPEEESEAESPIYPLPPPADAPEPATLVLAGVGLAGLAARRLRRRAG